MYQKQLYTGKDSSTNLDFVDGDLLDALTGGDGHLDVIKVHDHDDNLSTELWSNFCFPDSFQSKEILKITTIF